MTITEFLLARIAEDEESARSAPTDELFWVGAKDQETADAVNDHAARWQPARVVAECEAKRRIVERHRNCGTGYGYCDDGGHGWDEEEVPSCNDLADLASVYADHPDYDPAWRA